MIEKQTDSNTNTVKILECYTLCIKTINYCLDKNESYITKNRINTLYDCAEICNVTANFSIRDSDFQDEVCKACVDICRRCAAECRELALYDNQQSSIILKCADACNEAASASQTIIDKFTINTDALKRKENL